MSSVMEPLRLRILNCIQSFRTEALPLIEEYKWTILPALAAGYLALSWWRLRKLPPGPRGLPLLGYLLRIGEFTEGKIQEELRQRYGEVSSVKIGAEYQIHLNSYEAIKEAFVKRSHEFSDRYMDNLFVLLNMDDDVFMRPYNAEWKKRKSELISYMKTFGFGTSTLESKIIDVANALVSRVEKLKLEAGDEGICLADPMRWVGANLICTMLFSQQYEFDDTEVNELADIIYKLFDFDGVSIQIVESMPVWFPRFFMPWLYKDIKARGDALRDFLLEKVKSHMETYLPDQPRDYMDIYMDHHGGLETDATRLVQNCFLFMPDSIDTLSMAIEWVIVYAADNQSYQAKIQAEIDDVIGEREPTTKDRGKCHYIEAFLHEAMRKSSIFVHGVAHTVPKDTEFMGYLIPKGSPIFPNLISVHMDPKLFPDPEVFNPERFINERGEFKANDHVIAFGIGPRSCMGQSLTKIQMFIIVVKLFQAFTFKFADPKYNSEPIMVGIMRRPSEYKLIAQKR